MVCAVAALFVLLTNNARAQDADLQDVQRIVAIVNDRVISLYDLKQRILLFMVSSSATNLTAEEQEYMNQQALQSLVDDRLKMGEARKYEAVISAEEQEQSFARYASQFELSPEQFEKELTQAGIAKKSMLKQIEASIAWDNVVGGLLMPQVNLTDDEIYTIIDRFKANKGQDEYHAQEIFLLVSDNAKRDETSATAKTIVEQLRQKAPFNVMARQFSQSTTSAVGGDMGWVIKSELPRDITPVLVKMKKGEIADPIETEDGFYIIQLVEKRKILTVNPEDMQVTLQHLFFEISENALAEELGALKKVISTSVSEITSCDNLEETAKTLGAKDTGSLGTVKLGDMPPNIQELLVELEVGKATAPIKEEEGFRVLILCDKKVQELRMPDYDSVQNSLTQQRVGLIARRHLRDLRRDAIIDYK